MHAYTAIHLLSIPIEGSEANAPRHMCMHTHVCMHRHVYTLIHCTHRYITTPLQRERRTIWRRRSQVDLRSVRVCFCAHARTRIPPYKDWGSDWGSRELIIRQESRTNLGMCEYDGVCAKHMCSTHVQHVVNDDGICVFVCSVTPSFPLVNDENVEPKVKGYHRLLKALPQRNPMDTISSDVEYAHTYTHEMTHTGTSHTHRHKYINADSLPRTYTQILFLIHTFQLPQH